jgi:hypothetical protein
MAALSTYQFGKYCSNFNVCKSNRSAALRFPCSLSHWLWIPLSQFLAIHTENRKIHSCSTERIHFSIPLPFVSENERKYLFMEYKKNHHFQFYFLSACKKQPKTDDYFSLILARRCWQRQHNTLDIFRLPIVTVV